ncbi:MAG: diadenylate cyclase CdaA [Candidatus Omnitrophica bacterium]|nr:diadenylate cyclase CdaA [Candidatus Omnitrophota bacterium]MDD5430130.1 diadenylate cyclase CdaA [Candidatus Omnitrophota bacterium]
MELTRLMNWKAILEILILWGVVYRIFLFLKGTKAAYLLRGIMILIAALLAFQMLGLPILTRLLTYFFAFFLILVVIIFQPELREVLVHLGKRHIFYMEPEREEAERILKEIVSATGALSRKRTGALIALRREIGLKKYTESGVVLNADLSSELLQSIFYPSAPLHDGGVIIGEGKVLAASCLFPLSENQDLEKTTGMRHRAAVGLSENSDSLVITVSEENGSISLAINGQLTRDLTPNDLLTILRGQLAKPR